MERVRVGLIGCGFVAELHMQAYRRVHGLSAEIVAVAARGDRDRGLRAAPWDRGEQVRDWRALIAEKHPSTSSTSARRRRSMRR